MTAYTDKMLLKVFLPPPNSLASAAAFVVKYPAAMHRLPRAQSDSGNQPPPSATHRRTFRHARVITAIDFRGAYNPMSNNAGDE
ncbi:hypothetical protein RI367_008765 [Sorochytrium milnesiophthora]